MDSCGAEQILAVLKEVECKLFNIAFEDDDQEKPEEGVFPE
jgi:hypothetical protein